MSDIKQVAAHTPGPWELDSAKDGGCRYQIIMGQLPKELTQKDAAYGYPIADTMNRHYCVSPEEDEANGRLIAAAPEMLEALEEMYRIRRKQWQECADIAFVKGRTLLRWPDLIQAEAAIQKARGIK